MKCHKYYDILDIKDMEYYGKKGFVPICECGGIIKPDVVLYEESLDEDNIYKAIDYISKCDTLIVGGTSLVVYPAASFIRYFQGKNLIVINKGSINNIIASDLSIDGLIEEYLNTDNYNKYIK